MQVVKRRFVYYEEDARYRAPLELDSIYKALAYHQKSDSVTINGRLSSVASTAQIEWFFHGREVFERERERMRRAFEELNIPFKLLEYDVLLEGFLNKGLVSWWTQC